jgi:hypothetical protein
MASEAGLALLPSHDGGSRRAKAAGSLLAQVCYPSFLPAAWGKPAWFRIEVDTAALRPHHHLKPNR